MKLLCRDKPATFAHADLFGERAVRRRLAIFMIGGIGAGIASQGFPAIASITAGLADTFDVDVFSLIAPDAGFRPTKYRVISAAPWLASPRLRKLRWASLATRFLVAHNERPYDVLFSFWAYPMGTFVVALAALVRKPSVVTVLGAETASVPEIGYGHLRHASRTRRVVVATCARASAVSVVSGYQREALWRHGLQRRDVEVIPLGTDPSRFKFTPKVPSAPLRILHVANLTPVKDQATLIRGFAVLRRSLDARLRVVGPDHMCGEIQQLVVELGVGESVEFIGGVPHTAIPAHFEWADMFVLTSLSEGQNNALTEAAMSGVLQVSTPVGHIGDLGEAVAVVTRIGDPEDLAAKILAIVANPDEWEGKILRARAWAASRDLPWTITRFRDLITKVVPSSRGT
jgi:glycosyltransferase involved in cell wall biosynthesis